MRLFHACLGLVLAAYAMLVGLTGAALVFRDPINRASHSEFYSHAQYGAVDADGALALVRAQYPAWTLLTVTFPNVNTPYLMLYAIRGREAREIFVSADGAQIVGDLDPSQGALAWIGRLHTNLLGGRIGRRINGGLALCLLLLAISGLTLRRRFLHRSIGLATAPFLIVLCFTGAYFVWPQQYVGAVRAIFGMETPVAGVASGSLLPISQLVRGTEPYRITIPATGSPVQVTYLEGTPDEFHRVTTVAMDPVTGATLRTTHSSQRLFGNTLVGWFSAVHFGIFGGLAARLLWVLGGLAVTSLGITGLRAWRGKR